jgi:Reverse transcriptase (RNA-dependent DNA polymerase)
LVLSLTSGLVSPQFHVLHDDSFATLSRYSGNAIPKSLWQVKCGFVEDGTKLRTMVPISKIQDSLLKDGTGKDTTMEDIVPSNQTPVLEVRGIDAYGTEPEGATTVGIPVEEDVLLPQENGPLDSVEPVAVTRSGREVRTPARLRDYVVYHAVQDVLQVHPESEFLHPVHYAALPREVMTYAASSDPDTMYLHEAMREPDREHFLRAMEDEVQAQTNNGNWVVVEKDTLPPGTRILPAVWAMKRKRRILDGTVVKWKARLNVDGGKQVQGLDYWETYAPVASWSTIRMVLVIAVQNKWTLRQLDFVQAFPQAPIEAELYMEIPRGFNVNGNRSTHVLELLRSVYGQKQAGRVWNEYLTQGLIKMGFTQSKHDM